MERTNWTTEIEYILRNLYEYQGTEKIPFCYLVSGIPGNPPGEQHLGHLNLPRSLPPHASSSWISGMHPVLSPLC